VTKGHIHGYLGALAFSSGDMGVVGLAQFYYCSETKYGAAGLLYQPNGRPIFALMLQLKVEWVYALICDAAGAHLWGMAYLNKWYRYCFIYCRV